MLFCFYVFDWLFARRHFECRIDRRLNMLCMRGCDAVAERMQKTLCGGSVGNVSVLNSLFYGAGGCAPPVPTGNLFFVFENSDPFDKADRVGGNAVPRACKAQTLFGGRLYADARAVNAQGRGKVLPHQGNVRRKLGLLC